jgi:hypothetical protein
MRILPCKDRCLMLLLNMIPNFTWSEFWKHTWICWKARHKQVETYDRFFIFAITGYTYLLTPDISIILLSLCS